MRSNYEGHPWGCYLNLKPFYESGDLFFKALVSKKAVGVENVSSDLPDHFCNLISNVGAPLSLVFGAVCLLVDANKKDCWKLNHKTF